MRLNKVSSLLQIIGEERRLKIICLLEKEKELCVGDIAKKLKISTALASHHLRSLEEHSLLVSEKNSQAVFYRINDTDFIREFKKFLCTIYP